MRWLPLGTWARLLAKAESEGVALDPIPRTDAYMHARSARRVGVVYAVGVDGCSCDAGLHGTPCKHLALYQYQQMLWLAQRYGMPGWWVGRMEGAA